MQNKNNGRSGAAIFLVILTVFALFMYLNDNGADRNADTQEYSTVVSLFRTDKVSQFTLDLSSGTLEYALWTDGSEDPAHEYKVPNVDIFIADVREYVLEYNDAHPDKPVVYTYENPINIWSYVSTFLPILVGIVVIVWLFNMMNKQNEKIGSVGKARARKGIESERTAVFDDVAGAVEEKEELQEIVEYLKNPSRFNALGAKIPKGVLLVGPPGTGKTLLARAVAGEAGVPFYSISGSDFVEMYVGVGASRVRDLFDKAKKMRPSIIFIDEIDAVGRQRGAGLGGGHDEREQTLNQLLVELDGFEGNEGVIVMAATNREDVLDRALLRPGRFDRRVYVGYPDVKGREEILLVHSRNKPLGPDVDLKAIARTTPGFTGADLENLLNEAALLAAREGKKALTQQEIEEAGIKVMAGPEKKSRVVTEKQRRMVAYHEAGHAVTSFYATPESPVHMVTIIPRGQMGGFTMNRPDDDGKNDSKQSMFNDIVVLMGGRVAEELVIHDITTGASNDLMRASKSARMMVTRFGFSNRLGAVVYDDDSSEVFIGRDFSHARLYSEETAGEIDKEIRSIIDNAYAVCKELLETHIDQLHALANFLLENDKVDNVEFIKLMDQSPKLPAETFESQKAGHKEPASVRKRRNEKVTLDSEKEIVEVESRDVTNSTNE